VLDLPNVPRRFVKTLWKPEARMPTSGVFSWLPGFPFNQTRIFPLAPVAGLWGNVGSMIAPETFNHIENIKKRAGHLWRFL